STPERRFASMRALLDEIERGRRRSRWRIAAFAGGVVALALAAGASWSRADRARRTRECEAAGASIASVWNDAAKARVSAAFLATRSRIAADTAERVSPWLDDYASAWQTARSETCIDGDVRGTW